LKSRLNGATLYITKGSTLISTEGFYKKMVAPVNAIKRVEVLRERRTKNAAKSNDDAPAPTAKISSAFENYVESEIPSEEELLGEHIRVFVRNNPWCVEDVIIESIGLPARTVKKQLKSLEDKGFLKTLPHDDSLRYALG
jgi:hypothetical protein